jgi:hypothetical protein
MADATDGLTAGDWIGVLLAGLCAVFCFQVPFVMRPPFAKTFRDFGASPPGSR